MTPFFLTRLSGKLLKSVWFAASIGLLLSLPVLATAGSGSSSPSGLAAKSLLLDAARAGDKICAVGQRGHVLLSHDKGLTWRQVIVPTRATLTGVCFIDPETGWAVGHDAVILKTSDGGESWEKIYQAPDRDQPLLDVWFKTRDFGFALGAYGLCLNTRDGGRTWKEIMVSPDEWHLNRITETAGGILYIAAEAGQVYRSHDRGASWQALPSPYQGSFFGILPLEGDSVLVFGLRGHVFRVADQGQSWQKVPTATLATLTDGLRFKGGRTILVGLAGTVLKGNASLTGFTSVPGLKRDGLWSVLASGQGGMICFGDMGVKRLRLDNPGAFMAQTGIHITKRSGDPK